MTGFEPNEAECAKLNQGDGGRYYPYFIGDGSVRTFHENQYADDGLSLRAEYALARRNSATWQSL